MLKPKLDDFYHEGPLLGRGRGRGEGVGKGYVSNVHLLGLGFYFITFFVRYLRSFSPSRSVNPSLFRLSPFHLSYCCFQSTV